MASVFFLSRPGVLALVALAGFSGMVMASGRLPDAGIVFCTLFSLLLSAAGSVLINSVLDYSIDVKMRRLQGRVEAMAVLGRNRATLIACGLIIASLVISARYLNFLASFLIFTAVLAYIGPYTLWLKRRSPFGAVPGGIPGALPVLVGYAAVAGAVSPARRLDQMPMAPASMAGVGAISWTGWVLGTLLGAVGAQWIGDPSRFGVGFAMPAMFTALFVALLAGVAIALEREAAEAGGADDEEGPFHGRGRIAERGPRRASRTIRARGSSRWRADD